MNRKITLFTLGRAVAFRLFKHQGTFPNEKGKSR